MTRLALGPQRLTSLEHSATCEWLVTDGLGGYAMGTAAGLRTRRYHGLLVAATQPPGARFLGLAALDPVLVIGDARLRLGTHRWADGSLAPRGFTHLTAFTLDDGVPRWRWQIGAIIVERELAMVHGRPAVAIIDRLVAAPDAVRLELEPLCTWRGIHGERHGDASAEVTRAEGGFVFEGQLRLAGPDFTPDVAWYRGVHHDEETARGLPPTEDLCRTGTFSATLEPGDAVAVTAWADDLADVPPPARQILDAARARAARLVARSGASDEVERLLTLAADQHITTGPAVVAGYPWFGDWSRDTMTAYEGLFLETGRVDEGRTLLQRAADSVSEGMLPNTADSGEVAYNTVDATLWFVHAVGRHLARTGDEDLAVSLLPALTAIIDDHRAGTRYDIAVDPTDGLLRHGTPEVALTWMDARVAGTPITPRAGKAVEVNALWLGALTVVAATTTLAGGDPGQLEQLRDAARASFRTRFPRHEGRAVGVVHDVVDGPHGDDPTTRPNALLAVALPYAPLDDPALVQRCRRELLTPIGLRSLAPTDHAYVGRHRGDAAARDAAYHQGTTWPWLVGAFVEAAQRTGVATDGALDGLEAQLGEWGLGSVSETADGDAPHHATGCPFQAWSVAEVLRARRLLGR